MKVIVNEGVLSNLPFESYWDVQVKKGVNPSIDDQFAMIFGIDLFDNLEEIYRRFIEYLGGVDIAIENAKKLLEELNPVKFNDEEFSITVNFLDILEINRMNWDEGSDLVTISVSVDADGIYLPADISIDGYLESPGDWFDFQDGIIVEMDDFYYQNITRKTGIKISVDKVS